MAQVIETLPFFLCVQCHGCWWPGSSRRQDISNYGIDLHIPVHSDLSTRRVIHQDNMISEGIYCYQKRLVIIKMVDHCHDLQAERHFLDFMFTGAHLDGRQGPLRLSAAVVAFCGRSLNMTRFSGSSHDLLRDPSQFTTGCLLEPSNYMCWDIRRHTKPHVNTLRQRQNSRQFADDTFKRIFLNENISISTKISPKCVHKCPIKVVHT